MATQTSMTKLPIYDAQGGVPMNPISLSYIRNFHVTTTKDPYSFLFEFDVLCRRYDYRTNLYKLKLVPTILKGPILRWFMDLGGGTISSWIGNK